MEMCSAEVLARANRASLVAPAGCGKTHLIAEAVARFPGKKELILTHTHAGVDALRRKLRLLGASEKSYRVDTIAGFALRYSSAYPERSGLECLKPASNKDWLNVYQSVSGLFKLPFTKRVFTESYSGIYVDEYQDCTIQQHQIILQLSELVGSRIVGDPFQGIFAFGDNESINWDKHVLPKYKPLPELCKPWRWDGRAAELGAWLLEVRSMLTRGEPINLNDAPNQVTHIPKLSNKEVPNQQREICFDALTEQGTVVGILHWLPQCANLTSRLRGTFSMAEIIDCDEIFDAAKELEQFEGFAKALRVIQFTSMCATKVTSELRTLITAFQKERIPNIRKHKVIKELLIAVMNDGTFSSILNALKSIVSIDGVLIYRREVYHEMCSALNECIHGEHDSLVDAAWVVRNRTRHIGRRMSTRTIGRTHLVKGLEFDHCIILDGDGFVDKENLYVALTRGSKSLTIISKSHILKPKS